MSPLGLWDAWQRFWFQSDGAEQFKLLRRLFCAIFFYFVLSRTSDLPIFYGPDGLNMTDYVSNIPGSEYRFSVFHWFSGMTALWAGHFLLLVSLAALILGVFPRVAAFVAWGLEVGFVNQNVAVGFGVDSIAMFFLFYLIFADERPGPRLEDWRGNLGSAVFRLAQIQVCIIYLYAGLEKVRGGSWWRGEAMWYVLSNPQLTRFDLSWVAHLPWLLAFATYLTLFWEIYFSVLVWMPKWRRPILIIGVGFHLGIALTLIIPSFGFLMLFTYALFLTRSEAKKLNDLLIFFRKTSSSS